MAKAAIRSEAKNLAGIAEILRPTQQDKTGKKPSHPSAEGVSFSVNRIRVSGQFYNPKHLASN